MRKTPLFWCDIQSFQLKHPNSAILRIGHLDRSTVEFPLSLMSMKVPHHTGPLICRSCGGSPEGADTSRETPDLDKDEPIGNGS
jgi:hypothetical protein